jgi:hypothetical protein
MNAGTRFTSATKLGDVYEYEYIGTHDTGDCYNILIKNTETGEAFYVEPEWFNQHTITTHN